ncbi:MAG: hypothetical protein ONB46_17615 [candidate division KSB1 bacterium]|nr:hypothetical protein [candidate division KSB1 bacterium]MDZ7367577.1 hypothetical protein [candidate division KSB1 bacterium]MDZ7405369.1 hypothetical protein [candidate division KSB1 bacterium]
MIIGDIEGGLHPHSALEIAGPKDSTIPSALVDTGFDWGVGLHYNFADQLGFGNS